MHSRANVCDDAVLISNSIASLPKKAPIHSHISMRSLMPQTSHLKVSIKASNSLSLTHILSASCHYDDYCEVHKLKLIPFHCSSLELCQLSQLRHLVVINSIALLTQSTDATAHHQMIKFHQHLYVYSQRRS